jgi:Mrp family chromosome partitioning ATPase
VLSALPQRSQRIAVVSADGGAGRSVLAAGVACSLARHRDWPVALVDATGEPLHGLPTRLGTPTGPTMVDAFPVLAQVATGRELQPYVRALQVDGAAVHLFAAGPPDPERLDGRRLAALLDRLGELYPTVVVECPAGAKHGPTAAALAGASAVIAAARARDGDLRRAAGLLEDVAPTVGVVVATRPGGWNRRASAAQPVFGARCATLVRLHWDAVLDQGGAVTEVGPAAALTFAEIAASAVLLSGPDAESGRR